MKRLLLGLSLACLTLGSAGCCCWEGGGWTPFPWPGCGWDQECGWNGGSGCGWGGWCGWPCNRPGGCGDVYWGDWCTGNPHCSTCDGCGNWVGPASPGGNGVPPEVYGKQGPYGQQVARNSARSMPAQKQQMMARRAPPKEYAPVVRRGNPRQYPAGNRPQVAGRGRQQTGEYEGAIEYLGTTDRLVKAAELPSPGAPKTSSVAKRGEPTLAEPEEQEAAAPRQVRRVSRGEYVR